MWGRYFLLKHASEGKQKKRPKEREWEGNVCSYLMTSGKRKDTGI